jgi:sulfate adenylyltransferase
MEKILDERELCDLECLSTGVFNPLSNFMTKAEYDYCLETLRINAIDIFPIPIVCSYLQEVQLNTVITLKSITGIIYGTLKVQECWKPNIKYECEKVFGCFDTNHPYIQYLLNKGDVYYVSGQLDIKNTNFHNNFKEYRKTPAQLKELGPWVGFQTRNPLHRSHIELIKNSAKEGKILLHPVEGVTQECDIPFPVRMKCYKDILQYLPNATLSILPLSMRMAGPREAVWHAVIRRNHGCSHFIVGRDHAGPSYKKQDGSSFYNPLDAQKLAKSLENDIGITILTSQEVVYCEDIDKYCEIDKADGHIIKQISGTQFRKMLELNEDIPNWFSYPNVLDTLRNYYQKTKGACFYFIGLSGSGKTTLAELLKGYIEEICPSREVTILDADIIRTHLSKGLGFSKEDRSMNVRRIGYVASEIVRHGGIVIVANIAPYEEDRQWNRNQISQYGIYLEFFVNTPLEICEERDVKGLYKAARNGKITSFTGISDPFEIPQNSINIPLSTIDDSFSFIKTHCIKYL